MLTDKQIFNYCKHLVLTNLSNYTEKPEVVAEILELRDSKNNDRYLEHFKVLRDMLDTAIKYVENKKEEE